MSAPRAKPRHLEAIEQRLFVKRWRLDPRTRDLPACAIPNGVRLTAIQAALAKADGLTAGAPDWLCFTGRSFTDGDARGAVYHIYGLPTYVGLALEFKRATNKAGGSAPSRTSPEQAAWHADLRANGWRVEVVTSAEAAWAIVADYLGIDP